MPQARCSNDKSNQYAKHLWMRFVNPGAHKDHDLVIGIFSLTLSGKVTVHGTITRTCSKLSHSCMSDVITVVGFTAMCPRAPWSKCAAHMLYLCLKARTSGQAKKDGALKDEGFTPGKSSAHSTGASAWEKTFPTKADPEDSPKQSTPLRPKSEPKMSPMLCAPPRTHHTRKEPSGTMLCHHSPAAHTLSPSQL